LPIPPLENARRRLGEIRYSQRAVAHRVIGGRCNAAQNSGGYGADGIANYWADPTVGANSYSMSAFCNRTYSVDGRTA
jgi:hypothetical protein